MTSNYLLQTRSIVELDRLIEQDRRGAMILAETQFNQSVVVAVHTVGELTLVTNARIQADSQIVSAKLVSSAEVCVMELLAIAEVAMLDIQIRNIEEPINNEILSSMVMEVSKNTQFKISNQAQETINLIKSNAEKAIRKVTKESKSAIGKIREHAKNIAHQVKTTSKIVSERMEDAKLSSRTPELAVEEAKSAANLILTSAIESTKRMDLEVVSALESLKHTTDAAILNINENADEAEQRIKMAKVTAAGLITELVARPMD